MKNYHFIQGFLIGVLVWGAISVGLRYVHYQFKVDIPHVVLAPGKVLGPIASIKPESGMEQLKHVAEDIEGGSWLTWDNIQCGVGFCANMVTIIMPIISGIFSFLLWRKQKRILAA